MANKPNETNKAKADEANSAILTNKALKAIKVDDISLTKYSAILLKEKIYFEIFCNRNNQLGLDLAIVVMANMANELDVTKGRDELKELIAAKGQVLARGHAGGKVVAKGRARGHVVARGCARGKVVAKGRARGHVVARGRARGKFVAKGQARGYVVARSHAGGEFMAKGCARGKVLARGHDKGKPLKWLRCSQRKLE
jgi:hypothetical protein